jgi:hypothetical protein
MHGTKHPPYLTDLIPSWIQFWFVAIVPKHLNFATFLRDLLASYLYTVILSCSLVTRHEHVSYKKRKY